MHYQVDHRYGHHLNVGTPADPATAPRGMGAYGFVLRNATGGAEHCLLIVTVTLGASRFQGLGFRFQGSWFRV